MNKYGFYIKKLELIGNKVEPVSLCFKKGLNVVYGSSDTGKTFIFECIEFLLGKSESPKEIEEAKPYSTCCLEIKTYQGDFFRLERSLQGGDFRLINENGEIEHLKAGNKESQLDSISDFLLKICNLYDKQLVRYTKDYTKRTLYIQDLLKYFLVNEEKIITNKSLVSEKIDRGYNPNITFEKNVVKFLLKGVDESNIIESEKEKNVEYRNGKIALYDELIVQLNSELENSEYKNINSEIEKLDDSIEMFNSEYINFTLKLKKNNDVKKILTTKIREEEKSLIKFQEILIRGQILKEQYLSDIDRLKATVEVGELLDVAQNAICPICKSNVEETIKVDLLNRATDSEITKISLLKGELEKSQKIYQEEMDKVFSENKINNQHLEDVILNIQNELKYTLKEISKKIQDFSKKRDELAKLKTLKEKLDEYTDKRKQLSLSKKVTNKDEGYKELDASLIEPLLVEIETVLQEIKFDNPFNPKITYSEKELDFLVQSKHRKGYGKGYRAILHATFIIGILRYLRKKDFQTGLVIIDSPLNPYKADEKRDDGVIPNDLGENFYNYLAKEIIEEQVILIENTPLPEKLKSIINHHEFTRDNGFIPNKN